MQTIIKSTLTSGTLTYESYRQVVLEKLAQGIVTGNDQSEDLLHYTTLNQTRMNRLDKTLKIPTDVESCLKELKNRYIWLVISEGWCGDAAQLLPVFNKMANRSSKIEFKVVFRDEHPDLMNLFLTNGSRSIPKLIILEPETLRVLGQWGPRPAGADLLIKQYKAQHGVVDQTAKTELQLWYLHDKGQSTMREICQELQKAELS
jgi:hypothetical protein